eukprot:Gregarina_sp_Poly_1__7224@NODE_396_length_8945_cov_116_430728_g324_i0_p1_GENE_NODE_396_length_8945_cov_116_430728_g324_i0NODE_396_length_8945_cov_116_430728_g324_i0_p1_ORF_typecomplete_len878_score159_20_NODE_396_length_8945_cov_116_430728_g324_i061478780
METAHGFQRFPPAETAPLHRVTATGTPTKNELFGMPLSAVSVSLQDSEKEDLLIFVQAFAKRVTRRGFAVTLLTPHKSIPNEWEYTKGRLFMDDKLTTIDIRCDSLQRVPSLGVYFILQIAVGEAIQSELEGVYGYPAPLLTRMMLIRFKSPITKLLFICDSVDDTQQIAAALSLFRLVPRYDAAKRLQANVRRALASVQDAASRASEDPTPVCGQKHVRRTDETSSDYDSISRENAQDSSPINSQADFEGFRSGDKSREEGREDGQRNFQSRPRERQFSGVAVSSLMVLPSPSPKLMIQKLSSPLEEEGGKIPQISPEKPNGFAPSWSPPLGELQAPSPVFVSPSPMDTYLSPVDTPVDLSLSPRGTSPFLGDKSPPPSPMDRFSSPIDRSPPSPVYTYPKSADLESLIRASSGTVLFTSRQREWCCSPVRTPPLFLETPNSKRETLLPPATSPRAMVSTQGSPNFSTSPSASASPYSSSSPHHYSSPGALPDLVLPVDGYVTVNDKKRRRRRKSKRRGATGDVLVRIRDAHRHSMKGNNLGGKLTFNFVLQHLAAELDSKLAADRTHEQLALQEELKKAIEIELQSSPQQRPSHEDVLTNTSFWSVASGVVKVDLQNGSDTPVESPRRRQKQLAEKVYIPHSPSKPKRFESKRATHTNGESRQMEPTALKENRKLEKRRESARLHLERLDSELSPLVANRMRTDARIHLAAIDFSAASEVPLIRAVPEAAEPEAEIRRITGDGFTALFNKTDMTESSWMPNVTEGEQTLTLLLAERLTTLPGRIPEEDNFSVSASQLGAQMQQRRQPPELRMLSPLREDSGWQQQSSVQGTMSPLEKLKKAGHGLPTPFAQAAELRRSAETPIPVLSSKFNRSNV